MIETSNVGPKAFEITSGAWQIGLVHGSLLVSPFLAFFEALFSDMVLRFECFFFVCLVHRSVSRVEHRSGLRLGMLEQEHGKTASVLLKHEQLFPL